MTFYEGYHRVGSSDDIGKVRTMRIGVALLHIIRLGQTNPADSNKTLTQTVLRGAIKIVQHHTKKN